jgi:hypothetical protein
VKSKVAALGKKARGNPRADHFAVTDWGASTYSLVDGFRRLTEGGKSAKVLKAQFGQTTCRRFGPVDIPYSSGGTFDEEAPGPIGRG